MVTKMSAPGRSFKGVADYCLHDRWVPGQGHPESAERVEWTETRNLATEHGERAARIMAAPAEASPELKRLAGGAATGRKLEKPVCHYSLNWAKDEKPDRQEMSRAAVESLKALGMERHQALIVSHRDGQPHVHVIANRVDPESGKAAGLNRSKLKLSKWAERYEREQGKIRCPERERNNRRREAGERLQQWRGKDLGKLERRSKREWSALYGRQERQREQLARDCRGVLGRFRAWRELGGKLREIGGTIRGRTEVMGRFREELEDRLRWERVSLGKAHSEAVRGIESKAGGVYRSGMEGAEGRACEAVRRDELEVHGTVLRHRQAVAQPVVAPVPGGPDTEARHPDQTAPDRHPVAELGLQTAARCRTSVPPSPPSSPGPRAPGRRFRPVRPRTGSASP